ncbi:MAG: STAS/SEC14 domain-containing protein [Deltaproteobacteria bacterium]|nr:STAS/SEC14 domain-containing protein [Deltaproteobacteria bacterium]
MTDSPPSEVTILEPRMVSVAFHGLFDADDADNVMRQIEAAVEHEPFFMFEAVMSDITKATPEARRLAAERFRRLPKRAIAVVGGSFGQRMVAKLTIRAIAWLDKANSETAYFPESEDARAWLRGYAERHGSTL